MPAPDGFANGHLLWTPAELHARLGDENLTLVDLRPTHEVMQGVIPGAAHLDLYGIGLTSTAAPLFEEWTNLMRSLMAMRGVSLEQTVVFYEANSGMRAARAFWLLEYFGHEDVHVLDGGVTAWQEAGYALTTEMARPRPRSLKPQVREELVIGADALARRLAEGDVQPLDTRADEEYFGHNKRGGPRGGTIPGAVHLEWVNYLDEAGRFKPAAELAGLFEQHGVTRDKPVVPF